MKVSGFNQFVLDNLDLVPVLFWAQGPGEISRKIYMDWVTNTVKYIAVRPWEGLDLSAGNDWGKQEGTNVEHRTKYALFYHEVGRTELQDCFCSRTMRLSYPNEAFPGTPEHLIIRLALNDLATQRRALRRKHQDLRLDAICRVTFDYAVFGIVGEKSYQLDGTKEIEIFRPPADFLSTYRCRKH